MRVVVYLTGHGFGHYTRSEAALLGLLALAPSTQLLLRSNDRALHLARKAVRDDGRPLFDAIAEADVGPGVAQRGPLAVDVDGTRAALQQHLARFDRLVDEEASYLGASGARLVYGDVPPLAFAAAARAGLPSVALANFAWSWIYDGYAVHDPWFAEAAARLREAEARATLCLALSFAGEAGGLEAFPRRTAIAPVARRPTRPRDEVRAALFADGARTLALLSFGGFGDQLDLDAAARANPQLDLVAVSARVAASSPNLRALDPSPSLSHADLVNAADCVLGKPGYGTVAECLHRPTPLVYAPRGEFREQSSLVSAIELRLPSSPIAIDDLLAGRWAAPIARALAAQGFPAEPGDGASEAAAILRAML